MRLLARSLSIGVILATPLPVTMFAPAPAQAAANVQALVAQAEHNTNTVHTLTHTDVSTITTANLTVTVHARGAEDEVRNREQDSETVTVKGKTATGAAKSLKYTVDIIFMNGTTYYKTTIGGKSDKQWQTHKGMTFPDPYTGGWKRGRTTVTFPKNVSFALAGSSGGQTHVHASATSGSTAGTVDLWLSGGSKPYVVREDENLYSKKDRKLTQHFVTTFSQYNAPLVIQQPSTGGNT